MPSTEASITYRVWDMKHEIEAYGNCGRFLQELRQITDKTRKSKKLYKLLESYIVFLVDLHNSWVERKAKGILKYKEQVYMYPAVLEWVKPVLEQAKELFNGKAEDLHLPAELPQDLFHLPENERKSVELITSMSKRCPGCGTPISKVSGCDQMWCVVCHTFFNYSTGQINLGKFQHNPHYFQWKATQAEKGTKSVGNRDRFLEVRRFVGYFGEQVHLYNTAKNIEAEFNVYKQQFALLHLLGFITLSCWRTKFSSLLCEREIKTIFYDIFSNLVSILTTMLQRYDATELSEEELTSNLITLDELVKEEIEMASTFSKYSLNIKKTIYSISHDPVFLLKTPSYEGVECIPKWLLD